MKVMVTGGAGYIGSHIVRALQADGHDVAVVDDLSTGSNERLSDNAVFFQGSVLDEEFVARSFADHRTEIVVHVAAKKAVEESVADPLMYYRENVGGIYTVLAAMVRSGVRRILFSSSAAVYGTPSGIGLVTEDSETSPASPYGSTKLIGEQMIREVGAAEGLGWISLRYFNVAGADDPVLADRGVNNLIPRVLRAVTSGSNPEIYGDDYPTRDGTCIRDYIHVGDVATAHAAAVKHLEHNDFGETYNIGTGTGTSVLEVIRTVRDVTGIDFSWDVRPPRAGDPAQVVADASKITNDLGWRSSHDLRSIIGSAWDAWPR